HGRLDLLDQQSPVFSCSAVLRCQQRTVHSRCPLGTPVAAAKFLHNFLHRGTGHGHHHEHCRSECGQVAAQHRCIRNVGASHDHHCYGTGCLAPLRLRHPLQRGGHDSQHSLQGHHLLGDHHICDGGL